LLNGPTKRARGKNIKCYKPYFPKSTLRTRKGIIVSKPTRPLLKTYQRRNGRIVKTPKYSITENANRLTN